MEVPEADNSAQAVKRRMPPEIKQKLAKVARLAVINTNISSYFFSYYIKLLHFLWYL